MNKASRLNQVAFDRAVKKVTEATLELFDHLEALGPPKWREQEKLKAAERGKKRDQQMRSRLLQLDAEQSKAFKRP